MRLAENRHTLSVSMGKYGLKVELTPIESNEISKPKATHPLVACPKDNTCEYCKSCWLKPWCLDDVHRDGADCNIEKAAL